MLRSQYVIASKALKSYVYPGKCISEKPKLRDMLYSCRREEYEGESPLCLFSNQNARLLKINP